MSKATDGKRGKRGRPTNMETALKLYREQTVAAHDKYADSLPDIADKMIAAAKGECVVEMEEWKAAGTVTVTITETVALGDGVERQQRVTVPAFPDLDPTELVLVRKTITKPAPSIEAGKYATDRILGRPTETITINDEISATTDADLIAEAKASLRGIEEEGVKP